MDSGRGDVRGRRPGEEGNARRIPVTAAALLGSLPVVMVYMFFQRYFVAGLTAGAVKG